MYEKWCRDNGYARTALSAKTVASFLARKFKLARTRMAHRGEGLNRKTVREYELKVKK